VHQSVWIFLGDLAYHFTEGVISVCIQKEETIVPLFENAVIFR